MGVDLSALADTAPLLCFSHLRWNFVYQRPQHLLSRAARSRDVFFFEEPIFTDEAAPRLDRTLSPENVWVLTPVLPSGLNGPQVTHALRLLVDEVVAEIGRKDLILWYYTPMALPFSRHLTGSLCVYDNMDELSAFNGAHPRMIAMERELFRKVDVVFTGGQSLYESKKKRHPNVHAFPSSIDVPHFARARRPERADPTDQRDIPAPRIGFFGVIDERMDIELVRLSAALRPDWHFVMIGPVVKIDPATLPQAPNIHWLGSKSYQELPDYLAGWDVGFMPFALNEATRFISPTKTPEFLAAGLPVVSTAIRDVVRPYGTLGLVEIAGSAEELVEKIRHLLDPPGEDWLKKVDRHLSGTSWDATWDGMTRLMQKAAERRTHSVAAVTQENLHV
jgi:glycosyltransferase involved in cell wall biosynthesis